MKNILAGTAILALTLSAAPASAQLLGGAGGLSGQLGSMTGGLTGSATGSLGTMADQGRIATDTASRTRGSARGDRSVDLRRGRVAASGEASGGSTLDSATRIGRASGAGSGSASGSAGGGVDAQLVGTDTVRAVAGRGVNAVGNAAGRVRDTAGAVGERARGTAASLTDRAANSSAGAAGSASGSGSGLLSAASGTLALSGSGAAQGGAFPVNPGMAVTDAKGRAIGAVQSVRTNAQGAVERVLVKVGDRVADLPAANFSGSGSALVSAMGQGEVKRAAD
ncbi:hypothetical protein [Sphingomonas sp. Leaf21]|uniref:hypothetical protein n=1 Tax=Sphingomonas sp. Leaf21 TaxID=2876550 RepID=UPI001E4D28A7|nr:hypothetical protein [Sphingomonas sp. Leaf21]